MDYMNKTKRNLIIAAAVLNIISVVFELSVSIVYKVDPKILKEVLKYITFDQLSINLIFQAISCGIGLVGSIFLLFSVREKGKYFRGSRGLYVAGVIIIIFTGGLLPWILLLIAAFQPDIIIINGNELRKEFDQAQREEVVRNEEYELKKKKIDELKALRDSGAITEEEYKQKLFDLL